MEFDLLFFFLVLMPTDNGRNMSGLPTSFTSSAGFWPSGILGATSCFLGGGSFIPSDGTDNASLAASDISSSASRLKPGAALVFRLMPGLGGALADGLEMGFPAFLGGGRSELSPEKSPPPVVRARFAGGSSDLLELVVSGKLTKILPGLERSTTFWKGFFDVLCDGFGAGLEGASASEPESDSE